MLDQDGLRRLALHSCLDIHRVSWLRSFLAVDSAQMLCWYRALDAESVRLVLRQQGAYETAVHAAAVTGEESFSEGGRVVVEFQLGGLCPEDRPAKCADAIAALQNASYIPSRIFNTDGHARLFLIVEAEVEAAVERCLRATGMEYSRVWSCREIDPRPPELFATSQISAMRNISASHPISGSLTEAFRSGEPFTTGRTSTDLDALVIGAGIGGICALQRFLKMGLRVRLFDGASDVGGVWHWNRYPGARVDSETYTYGFSFSDELTQNWKWQELFSGQPEIERYLQYVVDRFDLRRHMTFSTRVTAASYDEIARQWLVETSAGDRIATQYLIAATGALTIPQLPDVPGIDEFAGDSCHTTRWPGTGVRLRGKRVGVIGTGATGVQVIQTIADQVRHLTVFQRTPTYCIPQRNRRLTEEDQRQIRREWEKTLSACRNSYGGFIHDFDPRSGLAVTPTERDEKFEALWQKPGFAFWFGNFADLMMNLEVNACVSEFVRAKIRQRVKNPDIARQLMPTHSFGTKRVPLENGYYEVYNRSNVRLVDLRETPHNRITSSGIDTSAEAYLLDVIIYATGFDAGTGALTQIDIRGRGELSLSSKWHEGPSTFLGLMVNGFPNLFVVNGPHNAAALSNATRSIEQNVDWIANCITYLRRRGLVCIEPSAAAEEEWTEHVYAVADASILGHMKDSWFFGANTPGKARKATIYAAGAREYREHCDAVARAAYAGCVIS